MISVKNFSCGKYSDTTHILAFSCKLSSNLHSIPLSSKSFLSALCFRSVCCLRGFSLMGEAIVPGRRLAALLRLEMVPQLDFFLSATLAFACLHSRSSPMSDLWSGKMGGGCFSLLNPGREGWKGGQ